MSEASIEAQATKFRENFNKVREAIGTVIIGHEEVVSSVLMGFVANGHVLLEGVPGLGKTLLVRTLAEAVDCSFSRIQFTPDLMPADITGTNIVSEENGQRKFVFQKGPIFGNIVLADEVNRATPKTQSALLEAMQEHRVTVSGTSYELSAPFFVLATQNPIEMEGTYPLPEAQLDRFMFKLDVKPSSADELAKIFASTTGGGVAQADKVIQGAGILEMRALAAEVPIPSHLLDYTAKLILATHPTSEMAPSAVRQYVRFGSSPRGGQSIIRSAKVRALMDGRYNVSADDIRAMAYPALRHRVLLNFEGEAEGVSSDSVISSVIEAVPEVPAAVRTL